MATRDETLTTSSSLDDALTAGTQTMESIGLKVQKTDSTTLDARGGSYFLTYWLGLFLPTSNMPVKVHYTVTEQGGSRTVQMHVKSSVLLALYKWKFRRRANEVADALKQGVSAKLA